jgi:hypothetical protein
MFAEGLKHLEILRDAHFAWRCVPSASAFIHPCSFLQNPHTSISHLNLHATILQNVSGDISGAGGGNWGPADRPLGCSNGELGVLHACRLASTSISTRLTSGGARFTPRRKSSRDSCREGREGREGPRSRPFPRNPNICGRSEEFFCPRKILRTAEKIFIFPQNLLEPYGTPNTPPYPPWPHVQLVSGRWTRRRGCGMVAATHTRVRLPPHPLSIHKHSHHIPLGSAQLVRGSLDEEA